MGHWPPPRMRPFKNSHLMSFLNKQARTMGVPLAPRVSPIRRDPTPGVRSLRKSKVSSWPKIKSAETQLWLIRTLCSSYKVTNKSKPLSPNSLPLLDNGKNLSASQERTTSQVRLYRNPSRLTCDRMKNLWSRNHPRSPLNRKKNQSLSPEGTLYSDPLSMSALWTASPFLRRS